MKKGSKAVAIYPENQEILAQEAAQRGISLVQATNEIVSNHFYLRNGIEDGYLPAPQGDTQQTRPTQPTTPTNPEIPDSRPTHELAFDADKNRWNVGPYGAKVELMPVAQLDGRIFPNALQITITNHSVRNGRCVAVCVDSNDHSGSGNAMVRYAKTFEEALANLEKNKDRAEKVVHCGLDFSILLKERTIGAEFERRMHGRDRRADALTF
jgi:hypothetical protein